MSFLWAILALALHVSSGVVAPLHAQSSRKDDIVFNSRGVPLAGASVRVCAMPASGQPCTPLALIYSDSALTQALANPTATDGLGNYFFYAAPGKYEIEISGPGITTKQIPNVVLPSDPSNPTFTGAVSAFSLNLSGNLTVNGNTSIVGNLASGTLNLANQGVAPGAAGAGTVNLYTKTADKRLYYKDDSGTEIGPIAASIGAQTNVANTFTAIQSFDSDFHNKGPNPWADVSRFGGYFGPATPVTTTGSITSGQATLTLGSAQDFANTQGILVLTAGPAPTIATPSGLTVLNGGPAGSTTYNYCVVAEDYAGGRTPCSTSAQITTGVATIGIQSVTGITCNRASGLVTCTKTAHGFQVGYPVEVSASNSNSFEGVYTVTAVTANTFQYNQYGFADSTGVLTSGTAKQVGFNRLRWNSDTTNTVLRSYIYRCTTTCTLPANAANYALAGVAIGVDGYFEDRGFAISTANVGNGDVPATAPTTASNDWLSTTISSGGGTTSLTLAANAGSTVAGATVLHDNTPNLILACNSLNTKTGTVFIPNSNVAANYFPIYSTFNMASCQPQTELRFANKVWQNGTIIPYVRNHIIGQASGADANAAPFYQLRPLTIVLGRAFPFNYLNATSGANSSYDDMLYFCAVAYQSCHYQDASVSNGGSVTSVRFNNVHFSANGFSTGLVMKGGFGFFFDYGGWSSNAANFSSPPAALLTVNCGLGNSGAQAVGINTEYTYVFGGIVIDSCTAGGAIADYYNSFRDTLIEGSYVPLIRYASTGSASGAWQIRGLDVVRPDYADQIGGNATPLIDASFASVQSMHIQSPLLPNLDPPVSVGASVTGIQLDDVTVNPSSGVGSPTYQLNYSPNVAAQIYANTPLITNGTKGGILYQMARPAAPQSAVVSAGGSVPVGTYNYGVVAQDYSGNYTIASPTIVATTTGGNQTVTVTLPATFPAGAAGVQVTRQTGGGGTVTVGCSLITVPGSTYVDTFASPCGQSAPNVTLAASSTVDSNGVTTAQLRLNSESVTASPRAEQNVFLPGAFSSAWTASSWTLDKAVTITRLQVQAKTAPAGCTTNAVVRLSDGTTPLSVTVSAAANDSGAIAQNYAAGATLTIAVQTAAAGCTTSPADGNVVVQYKMQ